MQISGPYLPCWVLKWRNSYFLLLTSLAGLGIYDPIKTASSAYETFQTRQTVMANATNDFDLVQHLWAAIQYMQHTCMYKPELDNILVKFTTYRAIKRAVCGKTSGAISSSSTC